MSFIIPETTEKIVNLHNSNWEDVFFNISPYTFAFVGIACGLCLSVIGAAWGIFTAASSLMGATVKSPRIRSKNLISIIFCEANAIYGVIIAVVLVTKVPLTFNASGIPKGYDYNLLWYCAYSIFASGLTVGLSNICSGISVGICGSSCALAHAQNDALFSKLLIAQIFASALGIYGIIVGIILSTNSQFP
ncbi:hypothetical protein WA158_002695 [Blastocystis sp. Blastoise]